MFKLWGMERILKQNIKMIDSKIYLYFLILNLHNFFTMSLLENENGNLQTKKIIITIYLSNVYK